MKQLNLYKVTHTHVNYFGDKKEYSTLVVAESEELVLLSFPQADKHEMIQEGIQILENI